MDKKKLKKKIQKLPLDVVFLAGKPPITDAQALVFRIFAELKKLRILSLATAHVLDVSFVDARAMKAINQRFRGKGRVTDVLSFEQPPARQPKGLRFLGDLMICTSVARHQARERRHSLRVETTVLLVHGLLHLLGFDHEKGAAKARRMRQLESQVLEQLLARQNAGLLARSRV